MSEPVGAGCFLGRVADRVHFPWLGRVFAGAEPDHDAARLGTHEQHALAGAEQVGILRRFVASTLRDDVRFPVSFLALGIFVPMARSAGEADDDKVRPTVAVEIVGPASEALAIAARAIAEVAGLANLVLLPVRRFVPVIADQDVQFAVLVHIGDGNALGAKRLVDHRLFPGNGSRGIGGTGRQRGQERDNPTQQPEMRSHEILQIGRGPAAAGHEKTGGIRHDAIMGGCGPGLQPLKCTPGWNHSFGGTDIPVCAHAATLAQTGMSVPPKGFNRTTHPSKAAVDQPRIRL